MKSNLIIIAVLAAAAIWFFGAKNNPSAPTMPSSDAKSAASGAALPAPTPASDPHLDGVPVDRLLIVRGFVRGSTVDGLIIECAPRAVNMEAHHVTEENEKEKWGDVMVFERGVLQASPYIPSYTVSGRVVLRGHPQQSSFAQGDRVKIIVAELPGLFSSGWVQLHGYTADFTIEGGKTTAQLKWNQQNLAPKSALDSGPRRR